MRSGWDEAVEMPRWVGNGTREKKVQVRRRQNPLVTLIDLLFCCCRASALSTMRRTRDRPHAYALATFGVMYSFTLA